MAAITSPPAEGNIMAMLGAAVTALPTYTPSAMLGSSSDSATSDPTTKVVGLSLAIGRFLIGASFVFKKKGLINSTKDGMLAGEGHAYLKSFMWWTGMLMMVAGEVCNFVAYAFVQPILVTPLGALSVVICAILSSIFLQERLNLQGKVGCAQCIVGATIIVLHAPEQAAVKTIQEFQHYMIQPVFLVWMGLIIICSLILVFKAGPKWGKQHMMIYILVCSLIGSLSVVATQGLGAAIVHNISTGEPQFNNWFTYFVIVFMVITLLTEINYLNKALNLFNTAMVTPSYYVTFTSTTIITSAIFYQGFNASVVAIITVCFGFLVICGGVLLLQTSKPVVPLQAPGTSSDVIGSIAYEELEPTAADMRASPFSSIRRISRDFRQPSVISSTHSVFQSSPLNPRAESLIQRKRRASNATSRPQSFIGHHLAVPGTMSSATGGLVGHHPTSGAYSTLVMGPSGSQIRVQLCEIVVADEKNETTRYQVFRPIHPHGDLSVSLANGNGERANNRISVASTGYRLPFLAPRGNVLSDSRASSVRIENVPPTSPDENEKDDTSRNPSTQKRSPISGSMFIPPKLSVSPPTPSPPASSTSNPAANSQAPPKTSSGPLAVSGSFFARRKIRSPSTSTAASADIMEINDPGHSRTVVAIEPVQQQPLYSLYIPPPVPHIGPKSVSAATTSQVQSVQPTLATTSIISESSDSSATANANNAKDPSHQKETSQGSSDGDESHDTHDTTLNMPDVQESDEKEREVPSKPKPRRSLFGKLFGSRDVEKDRIPSTDPSTTSAEPASSTEPTQPTPDTVLSIGPPPSTSRSSTPVMFNRTNHPTRISEGEEEEDSLEELKSGYKDE
ncbi:hypothetical protein BGX31_009332 [Mortierella sp. GBA43]|nr:hypothetical protein BGX31_009332 [Mortierella sp. GBA43]